MTAIDAHAVAHAAQEMADRFQAGATLFAVGSPSDAQHIAVEFLHPVIVGKRALPAMAVGDDAQLALLAKPGDIIVVASQDEGLAVSVPPGVLAITLTTGAGTDDPLIVRELQVTEYHLLWELTHVFLETCGDGRCVTCSDEAVEVTVVELRDGDMALVDTGPTLEEVSVALVEAEVGRRLLVHAKEAIAVVA